MVCGGADGGGGGAVLSVGDGKEGECGWVEYGSVEFVKVVIRGGKGVMEVLGEVLE